MSRKKFFNLSLITLIIGIVVLAIAYFFFHFVTDSGITLILQEEAGKPFVTQLIGTFGVLFLFASAMSLIIWLIFFDKEKDLDAK